LLFFAIAGSRSSCGRGRQKCSMAVLLL
jgi:hypothetical protein